MQDDLKKRDEKGVRYMGVYKKQYVKNGAEVKETADLGALLSVTIDQLAKRQKTGRPPEYSDDREGLLALLNKTKEYFEYIQHHNENSDSKLMPDVEGLCVYLGITRITLNSYAKRSRIWSETIGFIKDNILASKKQLAFSFKIPPIIYLNDVTNNFGYYNTNEFHFTATVDNQSMDSRPLYSSSEIVRQREMRAEIMQQLQDEGRLLPANDTDCIQTGQTRKPPVLPDFDDDVNE